MNNKKRNIFIIILLSVLVISSVTLTVVSTPVHDASGNLVEMSALEVALADASTGLLIISAILGLVYMQTSYELRDKKAPKKKNSYIPKHVMYKGRE